VVRLGGKKRAAGRNLQVARRFSAFLYNDDDDENVDNIVDGNESRKEKAQLSVACVFFTPRKCTRCEGGDLLSYLIYYRIYHALPNSFTDTPKFGKHSINPDTGRCWCHDLYGESKCWGCQVNRFGLRCKYIHAETACALTSLLVAMHATCQ
jgi:hypothetical protein